MSLASEILEIRIFICFLLIHIFKGIILFNAYISVCVCKKFQWFNIHYIQEIKIMFKICKYMLTKFEFNFKCGVYVYNFENLSSRIFLFFYQGITWIVIKVKCIILLFFFIQINFLFWTGSGFMPRLVSNWLSLFMVWGHHLKSKILFISSCVWWYHNRSYCCRNQIIRKIKSRGKIYLVIIFKHTQLIIYW